MTLEQYSFVVAADALGNALSSPVCGFVSDRLGSIRLVGIVTHALFVGGNVFYAMLGLIPREGRKGEIRAVDFKDQLRVLFTIKKIFSDPASLN